MQLVLHDNEPDEILKYKTMKYYAYEYYEYFNILMLELEILNI